MKLNMSSPSFWEFDEIPCSWVTFGQYPMQLKVVNHTQPNGSDTITWSPIHLSSLSPFSQRKPYTTFVHHHRKRALTWRKSSKCKPKKRDLTKFLLHTVEHTFSPFNYTPSFFLFDSIYKYYERNYLVL